MSELGASLMHFSLSAEALHALDQHILGIAQQAAGNPASQRLCPVLSSSNLYTPLAQRIILSSQQQAPKLQVQQLSIYPDPELLPAVHLAHHHPHHHRLRLPASGVKRLRLDSYSIASQLASGQVGHSPSIQPSHPHKMLHRSAADPAKHCACLIALANFATCDCDELKSECNVLCRLLAFNPLAHTHPAGNRRL